MPAVEAERRELVSALMDGQLRGEELARALDSLSESADGRLSWHAYHVAGDAMRSAGLAADCGRDQAFVERFRSRLAMSIENDPLADGPSAPIGVAAVAASDPSAGRLLPPAEIVARQSANDAVWRWKLAAIAASLAAVAVLGWNVAGPSLADGARLAKSPPVDMPAAAATQAANGEAPVMLRDPRLDELLAAHKQFGGTSALQMPAGFLRNATFDQPQPGR